MFDCHDTLYHVPNYCINLKLTPAPTAPLFSPDKHTGTRGTVQQGGRTLQADNPNDGGKKLPRLRNTGQIGSTATARPVKTGPPTASQRKNRGKRV